MHENNHENDVEAANIEINEEFRYASSLIENSENSLFITGKAGSGKSTLLQYIRANSKKRIIVLAPTGIAAINVEGQTIHSFFGFPWGLIEKNEIYQKHRIENLLKVVDTIIIDEISMVRVDLMMAIDYSLRINTGIDTPFGGIQMVFFGDMHQLSPIVKEKELKQYFEPRYGGYHFFNADVFDKTKMKYLELTKIYRQKDENFIMLLDRVRRKELTMQDLAILNRRVNTAAGDDELCRHLVLTCTNRLAENINERRLAELRDEEHQYRAVITGEFHPDSYPTTPILRLKKGAQVLLIKNDKYQRWVNGTLAVIEDLSEDFVKVNIDGDVYEVLQEEWEEIRYVYDRKAGSMKKEVIGNFIQYPLRLAWSITIHKSQGHTFNNIIIDLGTGAFAHGQTYVALSRSRSLEGISLRRPIRDRDIIFDKRACGFTSKFVKA